MASACLLSTWVRLKSWRSVGLPTASIRTWVGISRKKYGSGWAIEYEEDDNQIPVLLWLYIRVHNEYRHARDLPEYTSCRLRRYPYPAKPTPCDSPIGPNYSSRYGTPRVIPSLFSFYTPLKNLTKLSFGTTTFYNER